MYTFSTLFLSSLSPGPAARHTRAPGALHPRRCTKRPTPWRRDAAALFPRVLAPARLGPPRSPLAPLLNVAMACSLAKCVGPPPCFIISPSGTKMSLEFSSETFPEISAVQLGKMLNGKALGFHWKGARGASSKIGAFGRPRPELKALRIRMVRNKAVFFPTLLIVCSVLVMSRGLLLLHRASGRPREDMLLEDMLLRGSIALRQTSSGAGAEPVKAKAEPKTAEELSVGSPESCQRTRSRSSFRASRTNGSTRTAAWSATTRPCASPSSASSWTPRSPCTG